MKKRPAPYLKTFDTKINCPCHYCNERNSNCHSTCKNYITYKKQVELARINYMKAKNINNY